MNLAPLLNESGYDFYFLVVDKFFDIKLSSLKHFRSIHASHQHNSGQLLALPKTINYIQQTSSNRHVAIVPFKPSAKINFICQQHHWTCVSNPAKTNRILEDKIKFYQLCQQSQLPVIPSTITTLKPDTFLPGHVIQTRFGWAGKSTFQFSTYQDAICRIPPNTPIKISPLLPGYTLTNNCCLTHQGLIQSPPALQYTGLKPYTQHPFATVGRQWPCLAPNTIQAQVQSITQYFAAKILQPLNYQGFFGLDFLVINSQVYLLECNPRLTASFAFYTQLELDLHLNPLFFFHLAEFINLPYQIDLRQEQQRSHLNIIGSELTPKNSEGKIIDQIHYPYPFITSL